MSLNAINYMELDELQQAQQEGQERFKVTDLNSANWCLRKLRALAEKKAEVNALADAEVERIEAWRKKEVETLQHSGEYLEMLLTEFHQQQLQADPKAKTITTPYGSLKSTTRKPTPKKVDDASLLLHLKSNGDDDYIIVQESPAWAEYKKTLTVTEVNGEMVVVDQNGSIVSGVEADMGGTTFKVEVDI